MLDSTKTCPACGVSIDTLFALNNEENLTFHNAQYEQEQRVLEKKSYPGTQSKATKST